MRDPDHQIIDTNLDESLRLEGRRAGPDTEPVAVPAGVAGPFQWDQGGS